MEESSELEGSDSEEEYESKTVFVGPSQANWYKFQVARAGMYLSQNIPYFTKLPIGNRIFNWSFKVTVLSRDFETTSE